MATCIHCGEWFEGGSTSEQTVCAKCNNAFAFPPLPSEPTAAPSAVPTAIFDSYYHWLGIPPAKQPPNHYQLLGITYLETNLDVIATAADRQSAHLRSFLGSERTRDAERLLAEVDAARICLLNEHTKAAYDQVLSQSVPPQTGLPAAKHLPLVPSVPVLQPAKPTPVATDAPPSLMSDADNASSSRANLPSSNSPIARRRAAKPVRSPAILITQMVVGGIAGCTIGYYLGFVLLPAIRSGGAATSSRLPGELTVNESPRRSSNEQQSSNLISSKRVDAARPEVSGAESRPTQPPPSVATAPATATSNPPAHAPRSVRTTLGTTPDPAAQPPPAAPTAVAPPPTPALPERGSEPRTLGDFAPRSAAKSTAASLPSATRLPKRDTVLSQKLLSLPVSVEVHSPRLLTSATSLQEGEYLYLEEMEEAGVRVWTASAAIPEAAGDRSPREIGEFNLRHGELSFRWFPSATAEDEALLLNSMLQLASGQPAIALREAMVVDAFQLDMNERRMTHSFGLGAVPSADKLTLELGDLTGFPSRAHYENNVREIAIGRSATILFEEVPGAELDIKFQGVSDAGLTIAITPRFRENSASIVPMTKSQLETAMQSIEKTIVRTKADIAEGDATLTRLRSQSTARLTGAQAAGRAGLILKIQSRVRSDEQKLASLQAKLANGPKIGKLLDELHHRPKLAFRVTTAASSTEKITLMNGGWLSR